MYSDVRIFSIICGDLKQWLSRCAPVYTSVHENYFTVHRKVCKMKKYFLNYINLIFF